MIGRREFMTLLGGPGLPKTVTDSNPGDRASALIRPNALSA
jgi:hypothetical protein